MSHDLIYMNNAATSFPKFEETVATMNDALVKGDVFSNRDSIDNSNVSARIFGLRYQISQMIGARESHNICLTCSDSLALNILIQGLDIDFEKPTIIFTTPFEHNSVARPLEHISKGYRGAKIKLIPFKDGRILYEKLREEIRRSIEFGYHIAGAICSHGSNVTGDVIDLTVLGKIFYENNILFIVDVAQTLGIVPINVEKAHIAALAFAGHKCLNGPQGTGGFYIRDTLPMKPLLFGGTGNNSGEISPPIIRPDAFEVGTPAIHDLLGLSTSISVITDKIGVKEYREKILSLTKYLRVRLEEVPNIILYGKKDKKTPVVAFNIDGTDCFKVGQYLARFNIVCRTGIHCAAYTMKTLELEPFGGSVRLSLGYANTKEEVDFVVEKLKMFSC